MRLLDENGRPKWALDQKFLICCGALVVLIALTIVCLNARKPKVYENCYQIKQATGRTRIKEGDPLYQRRLDVPYNGMACE